MQPRSTCSLLACVLIIWYTLDLHTKSVLTSESHTLLFDYVFKKPARLFAEYLSALLLNFTRLHSHMHSPVHLQNSMRAQAGSQTICQGADHSVSTGRRAVTGNSLEGKWASETHLQTSSSSSWFSSTAERSRIPQSSDSSPKPMQSYSSPVRRFSTPHGDKYILTLQRKY